MGLKELIISPNSVYYSCSSWMLLCDMVNKLALAQSQYHAVLLKISKKNLGSGKDVMFKASSIVV